MCPVGGGTRRPGSGASLRGIPTPPARQPDRRSPSEAEGGAPRRAWASRWRWARPQPPSGDRLRCGRERRHPKRVTPTRRVSGVVRAVVAAPPATAAIVTRAGRMLHLVLRAGRVVSAVPDMAGGIVRAVPDMAGGIVRAVPGGGPSRQRERGYRGDGKEDSGAI